MTKKAHEITEAEITAVSLVKRGANRSPFKIMKSEESLFMQNLKKSVPPGGNYVAPATGGEEQSDTDKQAADRKRVADQQALERRIVELEDQFRALEYQPGVQELARQRGLHELAVEIGSLRQQLHTLRSGVAKTEDALDLLVKGRATAFGGSSQTISIGPQPSTLSKADQQLAADLRADLFGVRRATPATVKKSEKRDETSLDDLSNPFGIRGR